MNRHTLFATLLALVAFATAAAGADSRPQSWYLGGSWGATSFGHGADELSDGSIGNVAIDDSDTGWKIFGGRRFSEHLAIELGYVDLNSDFDNETTLSGLSDGSGGRFSEWPVAVDLDDPRAATLALVGIVPITERATALLKVGAAAWRVDRTVFHQATSSTESTSGVDATFGAGVQYRVGARIGVRLEWERYANVARGDIDLASLGVLVRLGRKIR